TACEKLIWHQTREPRPIREVRPEAPVGLAAVVERMMAKELGRRCRAADVAEALTAGRYLSSPQAPSTLQGIPFAEERTDPAPPRRRAGGAARPRGRGGHAGAAGGSGWRGCWLAPRWAPPSAANRAATARTTARPRRPRRPPRACGCWCPRTSIRAARAGRSG